MRDRFIFNRCYYESICEFTDSDAERADIMFELIKYILDDEKPKHKFSLILTKLIKGQINGDLKSYEQFEERRSSKYKKWREDVYKAYGRKCAICGSTHNLCVHHIKPFSTNPDLRYAINNGIVLCESCHRKVHKNER